MMDLYEFSDWRKYVNAWMENRPHRGHGERHKISKALSISTTLISQILKGDRNLSPEMALDLSEHIGLNPRQTDYFILLVDFDRASNPKLKDRLLKKIKESRIEASRIVNRIQASSELSEQARAIYYSSWLYTGVRNLVAVPGYGRVKEIAQRLNIPVARVHQIEEFLIEQGLCQLVNGELTYQTAWTHLPESHPLVNKHHQNWRVKGLQQMEKAAATDLFFTSPISLSEQTAQSIREKIPVWIEETQKACSPSPSETVRCLNIDWFEY